MKKYKVVLEITNFKAEGKGKTIKKVVKRPTIDETACQQFINDQAKQIFAEREDIYDLCFVSGWSLNYYLSNISCRFYYHLESIEYGCKN